LRLATRSQLSAEVKVVPGTHVRDGLGFGVAPARAGSLQVVRQPTARLRGRLLLGRRAGRGGPGEAPGSHPHPLWRVGPWYRWCLGGAVLLDDVRGTAARLGWIDAGHLLSPA
jgi:hypothetical protein